MSNYRRRLFRLRAITPLAVGVLLAASRASAQSVDYGETEQLFGEPVTTSVTGSPQRSSDVPGTMEIITADEIRRSGARDLPGVLRHVAGIDVLQWRNDDADVAVRGYNQPYSPRLLVLIDGRQVYADHFGYTPWTALPVELIEIRQIEVVKGPNSALFGFNAVGGVINIITYNPLYDRVNKASAGVGTQSSAAGSVVATLQFGRSGGARISAGGRSNDDFSTPQSPADVGTRRGDRRSEVNVRGVVRLGRNVLSEFEATTSSSDEPELSPIYRTNYTHYDTKSAKLQLSADTKVGLVVATAYSNWITVQENQQTSPLAMGHFGNQIAVAQLQDVFKIGSHHTLRASVEYRHNTMPTTPTSGAQVSYDVTSAAGMWDWTIAPNLALTNAIRLDHLALARSGFRPPGYGLANDAWNRRALTEPSFNTGLVWRRDAVDTFRLTAGQGAQMPSLVELGGLLIRTPVGFGGGIPTLDPTIITNYELGWDRTLGRAGGQLHVSVFHETARDVVGLGAGSDASAGLVGTPANIGGSEATGVELALKGTAAKDWRWGASYTPEFIHDRYDPGYSLATTGVDFTHTTPVHVVNANLGWAHGRWEADAYLRYESAFYGIQQPAGAARNAETLTLIPSYVSVDSRVGYNVTDRLTLSIAGQNITHSPQRQTSAPDVERRITGTVRIKF